MIETIQSQARRERPFHETTAFKVGTTILLLSGLVASDIFLPALPAMVKVFNISQTEAQALLSIFLLIMGMFQLFIGPLSDWLGRRPLLLTSLFLYSVSSLAMSYTKHYDHLLILRAIQATGACGAITLGRAIVGDQLSKEQAAQFFLIVFPIVGCSPAIAPLIGGILNETWSWKACFYFIAALGSITFILVWLSFPETRPASKEKHLDSPFSTYANRYIRLICLPGFWFYALTPAFAYMGYFAYIAESPFLMQQQGIQPEYFGYTYVSLSIAYVSGNVLIRKIRSQRQWSINRSLTLGYLLYTSGAGFVLMASILTPYHFIPFIFGMSFLAAGNGILLPLGTAGAMTVDANLSGAASGLLGAIQMTGGAIGAHWVGYTTAHSPELFGYCIASIALIAIFFQVMTKYQSNQQTHTA